jgi:glucokinase
MIGQSMPNTPVDNDSSPAVIALDVGGTSIKSALVGMHTSDRHVGLPLLSEQPRQTPIDSEADADSIIGVLAGIIAVHLARSGARRLLGAALGFPGPFDYPAGVSYIAGLEKYAAIYGLDVGAALRQRLRMPELSLRFRNDAEAAIVGEACYGAGRPYQRLIGVTLGTGCGSSFVTDGSPVSEGQGVPPGGWVYPLLFGRQRADDIFSRRGLEARLRQAKPHHQMGNPDIKEAAYAAREGDAAFRSVFECFGWDLGKFLAPLAINFRAHALLILGQISGAFDLFGSRLQCAIDQSLPLPIPALTGELGDEAALLGAADLYFKNLKVLKNL